MYLLFGIKNKIYFYFLNNYEIIIFDLLINF